MASQIFSQGSLMYILVTITTFGILVWLPIPPSPVSDACFVMAREGHVPRQLSMRGDRLSYSNGIILLSAFSIILISVFRASVTSLIGYMPLCIYILYIVQTECLWDGSEQRQVLDFKGFYKWSGSLGNYRVVIIIAIAKFNQGAYIVVILILY